MGHNSFIKGSITHVSLGFGHYLFGAATSGGEGEMSVPGRAQLAQTGIGGVTHLQLN